MWTYLFVPRGLDRDRRHPLLILPQLFYFPGLSDVSGETWKLIVLVLLGGGGAAAYFLGLIPGL